MLQISVYVKIKKISENLTKPQNRQESCECNHVKDDVKKHIQNIP